MVLYIPLSFPFTLPLAIVTVPVDTLFIPTPLVDTIDAPFIYNDVPKAFV